MTTRYPTAARNHALLYLTYLAGLRIGETLALRERDVDLDLLKLHVTRGKTGERIVPLADDPRLVGLLRGGCRFARRGRQATCSSSQDQVHLWIPAQSGAPWRSTALAAGSVT